MMLDTSQDAFEVSIIELKGLRDVARTIHQPCPTRSGASSDPRRQAARQSRHDGDHARLRSSVSVRPTSCARQRTCSQGGRRAAADAATPAGARGRRVWATDSPHWRRPTAAFPPPARRAARAGGTGGTPTLRLRGATVRLHK